MCHWEAKSQVTKQVNNLYFTFPAEGYGYENRDILLQKCLDAFEANGKLINDPEHTEFTRIIFVDSREQMLLHANLYVKGGVANIFNRTIHMVISDEGTEEEKLLSPPITHEIMHMVAMTAWGHPPMNAAWLNEGLATYAANNCSGYTVAELYRYFMAQERLIPIEDLTTSFYETEEMVGYHQSACIVEYLITTYGIAKFERLWKNGFLSFDSIYGFTYPQMESELNKYILETYPEAPTMDWATFSEGCK